MQRVAGKKAAKIAVYALSTCPWCHKVKKLLSDLGVEYFFTDVDQASGQEKQALMDTVKKWNPACSFPTIIVDEKKCIIGFKENEIREAARV